MYFRKDTQFERKLYEQGIKRIAGIDEVGRGPLAGPFVVSAVILDLDKLFSIKIDELPEKLGDQKQLPLFPYTQIKDSKKVSAKKRERLADFIKKEAISYSVAVFPPEEVDKLGISAITQKAFFNAIQKLGKRPQHVLTDTFEVVKLTREHQINIIRGDTRSISIAAASIVAKVFRDNIMIGMHKKYPNYGFDRHKGYGTKDHMDAIFKFGPCDIHRRSFNPVRDLLKS
ncbi:ribonuclease HII [Patescibacteria group bacterium]